MNIDSIFKHNQKSIVDIRKKALIRMEKLDLPNLGKFSLKSFVSKSSKMKNLFLNVSGEIPSEISDFVTEDTSNVLVIKDGNIIYDKLVDMTYSMYINDIETAYEEKPELVLNYFNKEPDCFKENTLTAYNTAYHNSGLLIDIPPNSVFKEEIKIFYIQDNNDFINRTVMRCGKNSKIKIIEFFISKKTSVKNNVTDIMAFANSKVEYTSIDLYEANNKIYTALRINAKANSSVDILRAVLCDANIMADTSIRLLEEGANAEVKVIVIGDGFEKQNINTYTYHEAKNSFSNIINHGIALNKSRIIFNNFGIVANGFSGSKAFQKTKGVILGKTATLAANPFLLIDEHDVEAGHGATIGRIDDEKLFYLMSRGLSKQDAEKLVINGLIRPIIDIFENQKLKECFENLINRKLGN